MKKNIVIIILILSTVIISLFLLINTNQNKKQAIKNGVFFLKNKINSNEPYYMKSIAKGDESKCGNCKNPYRGAAVYNFFISQAIGDQLNKKEVEKLTKKNNTNGESLWGYDGKHKEKYFNDADDTTFVMRAFEKLKINYNFNDIEYFYNKDLNNFSSFRENPVMQNSKENYDPHPEVNANIYNLFLETNKNKIFTINKDFIKNSQNEDGSFKSFYYPSKYYSTYMFLNFLCKYKNNDLEEIKNKATDFIKTTQNIDGSWGKVANNYETALAIASLKSCGIKNKKGEEFLIKNQNEDGSWDSDEIFWHFKLDETTSWDTYINSILTTAISLIALR